MGNKTHTILIAGLQSIKDQELEEGNQADFKEESSIADLVRRQIEVTISPLITDGLQSSIFVKPKSKYHN